MMLLSTLLLAITASASVVIIPGGDPKPYNAGPAVLSEDDFFRQSAPAEFFNNSAKLIMTSYSAANLSASSGELYPSGDSFIRGAIQAWGEHLHFVIRPDEVWFTILVQMNFYMLSHAEEIRSLFVDHEGQQEILVKDWTWYEVLIRFKSEIQARVKTPWLLDWLTPNFSTTTESDLMTANILMMGLTQAYFKYVGKVVCGLPSVTLLGTREDWETLLAKVDRLPDFGPEPAAYRDRLLPILSRFVRSFDEPDSPDTRRFWNQMVTAEAEGACGLPPVWISGWIAGFYYWSASGAPFARLGPAAPVPGAAPLLALDNVTYPKLDLELVPVGYARAPFTMLDWEGMPEFPAFVAAGLFGKQITVGKVPEGYREALRRVAAAAGGGGGGGGGGEGGDESLAEDDEASHAILQPMSGWMLYGPLEHDAPRPTWAVEREELTGLMRGAMKYMTGETCGVVDSP